MPDIVFSCIYTKATCCVVSDLARKKKRRRKEYLCLFCVGDLRAVQLPAGNSLPKAARRARIFIDAINKRKKGRGEDLYRHDDEIFTGIKANFRHQCHLQLPKNAAKAQQIRSTIAWYCTVALRLSPRMNAQFTSQTLWFMLFLTR